MKVEAPERIWIESEGECPYFYHEEELSDVAPPITEYVRADKLRAEIEALRAEVEMLQEAVRPRREDECLTLDHWRIRAYRLEENWARCSRTCAIEQDKREQAEARAAKLERALRLALKWAEVLPSGDPLHKESAADLAAARAALAQEASND